MTHDFNLTKFINKQIKKGNKITEFVLDSRGEWEGCTGYIIFDNETIITISDEVNIYDEDGNDIKW